MKQRKCGVNIINLFFSIRQDLKALIQTDEIIWDLNTKCELCFHMHVLFLKRRACAYMFLYTLSLLPNKGNFEKEYDEPSTLIESEKNNHP